MKKKIKEELCQELIKSILTKKDVYLFSYGLDEEENKYSKEEDDNIIEYYAWLSEEEMMEIQKELFIQFWAVEEEDMDNLHIVLDYVATENISGDTIIAIMMPETIINDENTFYYNRLFIFWDK